MMQLQWMATDRTANSAETDINAKGRFKQVINVYVFICKSARQNQVKKV